MATIIQIKRSSNTTAPSTLKLGELAYTYGTGTQGNLGDRLFIGEGGVDANGDANNVTVIGGQYFADKLDHADGTLTGNSALTVDSNLAIDTLNVGNSTTVGGTIKFNEGTNNGSNFIALKSPNDVTTSTTFVLPNGDGSSGQFLTTDGSGNLSFSTVTQTLSIAADTGSNDSVSTGETITFTGDTGITTTVSDNTITIDLDDTAVTPGTYGSSSAIPTFVVDQQGRITSASTTNVATTLTIVDESSTATTINLLNDTLKLTGGSGITTVASGDTISINLDSNIVTEDSTDTLTNKTIDLDSNTITGTFAEFNTAVQDATLVSTTGTETLTNKTIDSASNSLTVDLSEATVTGTFAEFNTAVSDATLVSTTGTETLTNKTIDSASNSLTLDLSEGTLTGTTAEFNTALSDGSFATLAGTETLTNKTIDASNNTLSNIGNSSLTNSSITIGSDSVSLGATQTDLNGITSADIDNITIDGNTISTTDLNGDLILNPNGTGDIDVNSSKIINVATPTADNDAANKAYVDGVVNGLDVKESVSVATTTNLTATYNNGAGTLTANSNGALSIDGVTPSEGARVLIKDQTTQTQNGIYVVTTVGDGSTAFVLTRSPDADTASELTGGTFFFVEQGTNNADNGYVATHNGTPTFGVTNITFSQFSGAGQISAGDGLTKTGNQLDVQVDDSSIEIFSDSLQVKALGITNAMLAGSIANDKLAGSITNNKLVNSTITFADDSSTISTVSLGGVLTILGGEGMDATFNGDTLTISGENASTSNKGVASFSSDNFIVSSGAVSVSSIDGGTF